VLNETELVYPNALWDILGEKCPQDIPQFTGVSKFFNPFPTRSIFVEFAHQIMGLSEQIQEKLTLGTI
jgi:hypothetical protein